VPSPGLCCGGPLGWPSPPQTSAGPASKHRHELP
jgi:hypothetical protein